MTQVTELKRISLFSQLGDEYLATTLAALKTKQFSQGEILFNLGDPGDEMFVVQTGSVAVFAPSKDKPGDESPIRIFGPNETVGEMALIDGQPRSLSGRALEPTQVLVLTRQDFHRLLHEHPDMAIAVMTSLNERIRYTTEFLSEVSEWVRRVAEGNYERGFRPSADYQDRSISALAREFAQMAAQVKKREEELRQQVAQLRIEIDETKKQRQVDEIVGSDYFQSLQARAKNLRRKE
jgi:CRP-like cAMP-binding protein